MVLVFGGWGSAVLAAAFFNVGIGLLGGALAFGLSVLTMAYAIGHISGCHLDPAVTFGFCVGKRFPADEIARYIVAQVLGATKAAGVLDSTATGKAGFVPNAIGLGLTLIHLISMPGASTSVNAARSTGPAVFASGWALAQLSLFCSRPSPETRPPASSTASSRGTRNP